MNNKTDNSMGIAIKCPHCEATLTVYHLDWSAIICLECKGEIANPTTKEKIMSKMTKYFECVCVFIFFTIRMGCTNKL